MYSLIILFKGSLCNFQAVVVISDTDGRYVRGGRGAKETLNITHPLEII